MTHKEATKNLTELQIQLINDNSKEAIEYNKKIYDTLAYFITQTIPLSVIKKITTEIEERATYEGIYLDRADVLDIIDKAVKECTHETN